MENTYLKLSKQFHTPDPEAQELAKSLINKLLAKGHLEFRKFLN